LIFRIATLVLLVASLLRSCSRGEKVWERDWSEFVP